MRYEFHNLDGQGDKRTQVYDMPAWVRTFGDSTQHSEARPKQQTDVVGKTVVAEYWAAVTDVSCPAECGGTIRWAEAGYVPGYRICDGCGRHFLAKGDSGQPTLVRVGSRRSKVRA